MDELFSLLEGICPDCGGQELAVTVTCHPNQAAQWSGVTVVERSDLAPNFIPPGTPWRVITEMSWAETTLALYSAKCQTCGTSHYTEQSATSGDWRI
jgi:hypothetical protein